MPRKSKAAIEDDLLTEIRKRFDLAAKAETQIREDALEDLKFVSGDQWDPKVKRDRDEAGRPALTFNRLTGPIQQVLNEQRQNRPSIKISPVEDGDKNTAGVLEGMVRNIQRISRADIAYDTAFEYSCGGGFGYFRVLTEYVSDQSFDQDIKIARVPDPFCVYFDPGARELDYSDAEWAFVIETMTKEQFEERWPDSNTVEMNFFHNQRPSATWIAAETVQIAEYWKVVKKERELRLLRLDTGAIKPVYLDELKPEDLDQVQFVRESDVVAPDGTRTPGKPRSRKVWSRQIKQYLTNGYEILDQTDWPGVYIPVIPVLAHEIYVDGKRMLVSLVRHARDPQRLFNYYRSSEAENVGLAPKAPFVGAVGSFKTKAKDWQRANQVNFSTLEYDPVTVGDRLAPPPARNQFEPPIQALSVGAREASDDIKAATNVYDPSLGLNKASQSGKAILALQREGDVANFHLIDNLTRALWHCGRILVDLIPKIYDTERQVRVLGQDDKEKIVKVNAEFRDSDGSLQTYKLAEGRYDVNIEVGPSFATKRQEATASMTNLVSAVPQIFPAIADLFVKGMDWPMADEIADRLTPPEYKEEKDGPPIPEYARKQIQVLMQQHAQLTQALEQATDVINGKKLELESRERIAAMNAQVQLLTTEAKIRSQEGVELLKQEIIAIGKRLDILNQDRPVGETGGNGASTTRQAGPEAALSGNGGSPANPRALTGLPAGAAAAGPSLPLMAGLPESETPA